MAECIGKLIEEYKSTKESLEHGLEWLPNNIYAKSKIEVMNMIIRDLENLQDSIIK